MLFCFGLPGNPTAGDGSITGRVVSAEGVGIRNARITVVHAVTGETVTALTNAFGYYSVGNLPVAELYVMTISHKRYTFAEKSRTLTLNDSFSLIDFVANP